MSERGDEMKAVDVTYISVDLEVAEVLPEGERIPFGVNLWELHPNARKADGFTEWKYRSK